MRTLLVCLAISCSLITHAKEWRNLRVYKKQTNNHVLSPTDWLKKDRTNNTLIWQQANIYNLQHGLHQEYSNVIERRDFYKWLIVNLDSKGHEVIWPKMAHYISSKLRLTKAFPYTIFIRKNIKNYANEGSETVFRKGFSLLKELYFSKSILKGKQAEAWDKAILYEEQYYWIEQIYQEMDNKSINTIERMAKGKGFYSFNVPKSIRFKGDISSIQARYDYAIGTLRPYCKKRYN